MSKPRTGISRRHFVAAAPAIGVAATLGGTAAHAAAQAAAAAPPPPPQLHRTDDPAKILAVAREILGEDWVGTLITVDEHGVPRARSVGVSDPDPDMTLWVSTKRGSRKLDQIARHPQATLHFAKDDLAGNFATAYYASFMGEASAHTDAATIAKHGPPPEMRSEWPNYPKDVAVIRFRPRWLEVYGRGIKGKAEPWQPQGIVLPR